jgi:hypothetical protein
VRTRRAGRSRRSGRLSAAGVAKLLLVLGAALYLAWWVVRISVVDAEIDENPFFAARIDPDHPRVRMELAMAEIYLRQGRASPASESAALASLAQAPLADEPFFLAGLNALVGHDDVRAERLLQEARRRNPRLRMARLLLLDRYLREGRTQEAGVEMAALSRLIADADNVLTPALARMVQDPATSVAMVPMVAHQPRLQGEVLDQLAVDGADPDLILRIASAEGRRAGPDGPWRRGLLENLVAKEQLPRALNLWQLFSGLPASDGPKGLYDGRFAGLPGPPPFNWNLATGAAGSPLGTAGVAERIRNGGLQVEYYGRQDGDLASQLMMLRPGLYRLGFTADGDAKGDGSRLVWSVSCQSGNNQLLQLPVAGVASAVKRFAGAFRVPPGCPAQWLRLRGVAGDVASDQNLTIHSLSIAAEGAR